MKCYEASQCARDSAPLRLFMSGAGGTGEVNARVNSIWTSEGLLCVVAAPTGLAAFNVGVLSTGFSNSLS